MDHFHLPYRRPPRLWRGSLLCWCGQEILDRHQRLDRLTVADETNEILGLWLEQNEGAKFSLRVINELKSRGVGNTLIAIVDGLKDFPEAIVAIFPEATVQPCIVHLLRHSLEFAPVRAVRWFPRR
jgi:hypothetical protein